MLYVRCCVWTTAGFTKTHDSCFGLIWQGYILFSIDVLYKGPSTQEAGRHYIIPLPGRICTDLEVFTAKSSPFKDWLKKAFKYFW